MDIETANTNGDQASTMTTTTTSTTDSFVEPTTMKLVYFSNEFPADDLKTLFRRLHNHSKDRRHPILARFIHEATLALREEIEMLSATYRSLIRPFETILNLVDDVELRRGLLSSCIDGMLLCVYQPATIIGYYEDSAQDKFDFNSADACLAGLGTGLLSAAAVSLSASLADMPLAGAEVIRVAFRLGVLVVQVSQNLQPSPIDGGLGDSWAYVVPDAITEEVQHELDSIHAAERTPDPSRVFISALSRTSVTVSGPPARLKHIFHVSAFFRDRKFVALPVYGGLCHAKHIYTQSHTDSIVQILSLESLDSTPHGPVFSTSTGRPFPAKSAKALFQCVVNEILMSAIQWDKVIEGVLQRAQHSQGIAVSEYVVLTFRTSLPMHDLVESMGEHTNEFNTRTVDLVSWIAQPEAAPRSPLGNQQAKIAIVGMACRMPGGATDTDKFWDILSKGLDVHKRIPADRFDVDSHCDPTGKRVNTSLTPYGCFIDEPGLFDAPFFNMSPREALQTDPMQRLALVTAYEALERAGFVPGRNIAKDRIGTFYGQASDDYREVNTAQEVGTYFITGGCRAFGPGRINYFFKFAGPSYSLDTACSSGLATIHVACNSIWNGDVDMVVAGGMNVLTNSDAFAGRSSGHFLSKTPNACKTWDAEADGYCRADGVASVVLKRLEDAEADYDNILGVILGAGTNHSPTAVSITHPHAGHQADLTKQILDQADVDPLDVSYVEMHGTGTQAGDSQEIQSVANVFAPLAGTKRRSSKQPLHIGAVKANVGHGEAVAGTTALLKVLLMFDRQAIPQHVGIKNAINPGFPKDLDKRQLHIPYKMTRWLRYAQRRRTAVINNFSAAGGNTSIVIEEPPSRMADDDKTDMADPRSTHVVTLSAKSKASLKGNIERLLAYLEAHPDTSLADLGYTTTARRHHYNHRVATATPDLAHLKRQLSSHLASIDRGIHKPIPSTGAPPVVLAFTGQGSSHRSMNLELLRDTPTFHMHLLYLDSLCTSQGLPSFIPAVDGTYPQDHAHSATVTQLALVCTEIALARYWESLGVRPDVVIGHSLGEYAALHVAGVLSATDAIFLVGQRAMILEHMCRARSQKMLAVRASLDEVRANANGQSFEVACLNGPRDTVLSGIAEEMVALCKRMEAAGFKCSHLDVEFAFHSAQMDPILDKLEEIARTGVLFQPPHLPIVSPLLGKVIFDEKTVDAKYVRRATRETINFLGAMETACRMSTVDESIVWIEIGPHPVCMGFAKSAMPTISAAVPSLRRDENNWATISQSLAAVHAACVDVEWNEFHRSFKRGLRLLDLPTYAWNDKTYWIQYDGDWALTKGNTYYDAEKKATAAISNPLAVPHSGLQTSLVHRIVEEDFSGIAGRVVVQSDMMQTNFLAAAWGHKMNGAGVVTSSIHADVAWTMGKYLLSRLRPHSKHSVADMDIRHMVVREGLVAQKNTLVPQLIQVSITTDDNDAGLAHLQWHNVSSDGFTLVDEEPVVTCQIVYGNSGVWLSGWLPTQHLVQGRIEALARLANEGVASRLSHGMAYLMFAANLVDYADKYRGMQSVVIHGLEAYADVTIKAADKGGVWTMPPFFVDSVCHLAGFVMNVSDAIDTKKDFCVTPGWGALRIARPLIAGASYRSYVKMIPTKEDPTVYLGDVYILQGDDIVGVMQAMQFRRYPRVLLNRLFSPADVKNAASGSTVTSTTADAIHAPKAVAATPAIPVANVSVNPEQAVLETIPAIPPPKAAEPIQPKAIDEPIVDVASDSTAAKAMALVAAEAGIDPSDIVDDARFSNIGVDSLMSLVIAERLREQLGITVSGSLFLEYPTVGDLRAWLIEYYD